MSELYKENHDRKLEEDRKSVSERCLRLKKAIEAAGGNSVVSKRSGIPKGSLSNYVQGRDMKAGTLAAIADACGVTLDWLVRGNEKETAYFSEKAPETEKRVERLKEIVRKAGGERLVSDKTGIPLNELNAFLSGQRSMKIETAVVLARICGVSLEWLAEGGKEDRHLPTLLQHHTVDRRRNHDDAITIPFFQTEASAGTGIISGDWEDAEEIHISKGFLRSIFGYIPKDVLLMKARGDSMQPTIQSQDVLIVNYTPSNDLRPGIYIMAVNDTTLVKRLDIKTPRTYEVISDNKEYNSFDVSMDEICWGDARPDAAVRIIGKVEGHIHLNK